MLGSNQRRLSRRFYRRPRITALPDYDLRQCGPGSEHLQTIPHISRIGPRVLAITGKPTLALLGGPQFLPRLTPGPGRMAR